MAQDPSGQTVGEVVAKSLVTLGHMSSLRGRLQMHLDKDLGKVFMTVPRTLLMEANTMIGDLHEELKHARQEEGPAGE